MNKISTSCFTSRPIHTGQSFPWTSFETLLRSDAGSLNAMLFLWKQTILCHTGCGRDGSGGDGGSGSQKRCAMADLCGLVLEVRCQKLSRAGVSAGIFPDEQLCQVWNWEGGDFFFFWKVMAKLKSADPPHVFFRFFPPTHFLLSLHCPPHPSRGKGYSRFERAVRSWGGGGI